MSNADHKEWLLEQKEKGEKQKKEKIRVWKETVSKRVKKKAKKVVKKTQEVEEDDDDDDEVAFDKENKWGENMEEDQEYLFFE